MNEILDQLRTTLASSLTTRGITTFFKGRQDVPAQSDVPIVMIYPNATRQVRSGTVRDRAEYDITIELQVSIKQYFDNEAGQGTQLDTLDALIDVVEERETDGDAKTTTILGIINANLTIGSKVLYTNNVSINYDPYYEAGEFPMAKAIVTFTAYDRPNRT